MIFFFIIFKAQSFFANRFDFAFIVQMEKRLEHITAEGFEDRKTTSWMPLHDMGLCCQAGKSRN